MTQDNSPLADIAGSLNFRTEEAMDRHFNEILAFRTLISDIRNDVVKIVPCDVTKTDNQYGSMDGWLGDNYRNACGNVKIYILASPIYEPIKQFLGDEK